MSSTRLRNWEIYTNLQRPETLPGDCEEAEQHGGRGEKARHQGAGGGQRGQQQRQREPRAGQAGQDEQPDLDTRRELRISYQQG